MGSIKGAHHSLSLPLAPVAGNTRLSWYLNRKEVHDMHDDPYKEKTHLCFYKTWQFLHGWDSSRLLARPSQSSFLMATDGCERSIEDTESLEQKY